LVSRKVVGRASVVLATIMPSTRRERAICTTSSSSARLRSGAILSSTGESPAFCRTRSRASITLARSSSRRRGLLQVAQGPVFGRRHVDGEIARHRREGLDQPDVIGDPVGGILVGADIDPDNAATMRARREPPQHRIAAVIVEAHAVDHGFVALQPEQPRPRIAGLRFRGHRADLGKAETRAAAAHPAPPRSCRSPPPFRSDWGKFRPNARTASFGSSGSGRTGGSSRRALDRHAGCASSGSNQRSSGSEKASKARITAQAPGCRESRPTAR
jgi:hypothetical protein